MGVFPKESFTSFTTFLGVFALFSALANGICISDKEDQAGFLGKAAALSKGLIYKYTNYFNLFILIVYTVILIMNLEFYQQKSPVFGVTLPLLVILNLGVPILTIYNLDVETIKQRIGEPSDIDKELSNKAEDLSISQITERGDFWFYCIISFITIGSVRTIDENAILLSRGNEDVREAIEGGYNVFEVVGALSFGVALVFFRAWFRPSLIIIFQLIMLLSGYLIMVWPNKLSFIEEPIVTTVKISAAIEGGLFVSLATFVHEEYGTENYALVLGTFMSAGSVGLYIMNQILI